MLPSARIEAVIELTAQVAHSLGENGPAADVLVQKYFSSRRYAGSKDRRRVTNLLYDIIFILYNLYPFYTSTSISVCC